jgi:hypothetical protein
MDKEYFQKLTDEEVKLYKKWARDNYQPFERIKPTWHPVIIDECGLINTEEGAR